MSSKCAWPGCGNPNGQCIDGVPYCRAHYRPKLLEVVRSGIQAGVDSKGNSPVPGWRNRFARYATEECNAPESLTKSQVESEAHDFQVDGESVSFSIIRRPAGREVIRRWKFTPVSGVWEQLIPAPITIPLKDYLAKLPHGPVENKSSVEHALAEKWNGISGSGAGGMQARKIIGRTEDMAWEPPFLTFTVERHGATVNGSTRAELQNWQVNPETCSAKIVSSRPRQLYRMDSKLKVQPLAEEVAKAIRNDSESASLKRLPDGRVKVLIGNVIPDNGYPQTIAGRRKRFRECLGTLLLSGGWVTAGVNTYQRKNAS